MLKYILIAIYFIIFQGCEEKQFDPNNPQTSFAMAKEPYDDENYELAIIKLGEFKARFPYSRYAIEAELLMANSHFENGDYAESAAAYNQFATFHPNHPQVAYALFRVGASYWADAPEEIDREQEFTHKAIAEWQKLINTKSKSKYTEQAKELIKEGKLRLARSEEFIANFYCEQEIWHACAYRNIQLAARFPEYAKIRYKAVVKAADALLILAKEKDKDEESDKNLYFKNLTVDELKEKSKRLRATAQSLKKRL